MVEQQVINTIYKQNAIKSELCKYEIKFMMTDLTRNQENEIQIQQLKENWANAVRNKDMQTILAHHSDDIVMYDVPKPFQSIGIDAYRKTWDTFFAYTKSGVFDIQELHIVADENVAFCFATMKCADLGVLMGITYDEEFKVYFGAADSSSPDGGAAGY